LGCATAVLVASDLSRNHYSLIAYTFGAPRVGDQAFVDAYQLIPTFRYVNFQDIVTRMPPRNIFDRDAYWHQTRNAMRYGFSIRDARDIEEDQIFDQ